MMLFYHYFLYLYNSYFRKTSTTKIFYLQGIIQKVKTNIKDYKEEKIRDKNRFFRRVENYKYDTSRKFSHGLNNLWRGMGSAGLNFLNIIPE